MLSITRMGVVVVAIVVSILGAIVGVFYFARPQPATNETTAVTSERVITNIPKPTKTPTLQLADSDNKPGHMAVVVMTGLRPDDIIPADTIIELRVVTKDGLLILEQTALLRRNYVWYEFVIPKDQNYNVCQGRPLYVSIRMETPSEMYLYRGPLKEWRGIDDMCLPFTR